jgi:hypothetical protein
MRIARLAVVALLAGCASEPPRQSTEFVHLAVGPAGVVRSDSWRGEYPAQPQVSCPLELARVCITERDAPEAELTVTLGTLIVRESGEVTLDGRLVALRAERVTVEQLDAPSGTSSGLGYGTTEKIGEIAQDTILALGVFASLGLLYAFGGPSSWEGTQSPP